MADCADSSSSSSSWFAAVAEGASPTTDGGLLWFCLLCVSSPEAKTTVARTAHIRGKWIMVQYNTTRLVLVPYHTRSYSLNYNPTKSNLWYRSDMVWYGTAKYILYHIVPYREYINVDDTFLVGSWEIEENEMPWLLLLRVFSDAHQLM